MPHLMSGSPLPNKKALNLPSALRRSLVAAALAGLLLSAPPSVLAQTPPIDTRATVAVSQADFPEADSVLMLDDIRFDVKPDRTHIFDEHDVVKALTSDGVEENASLDRILDESQTRIEVLRARTIKADGTVVNSPPPQLTPLAPNSPIYSSIKRFSLRFPDLEVGDMVEFHLRTIHKPKPGGHFWATTYVENPMPILDSSFVVTVPKGVSFQTATPNLEDGKPLEETVHIEGTDYRRLSWAVTNKNAFQFQALSPPPLSLLGRIEISSFQNWDEVADYVGQRWKANSSISEGLALRIAGWLPTPSDTELRAKSVLKEIGRHRRAASFLSEEPVFHRPSQTFPEELISMADSSLLTSVALSSAGVPNIPVAVLGVSVSSLQNQLPHPEKIERIILEVPISGRDSYWVDPEAPGFLLSSPPPGASGTAAISWDQRFGDKKGGPQNLAVAPALQSREELAVEGRLERNGRAELTLQFDRYGNAALNARQAAREIQEGTRGVRERTLDSFFSSAAQAYGNRARLLSRFFREQSRRQGPV